MDKNALLARAINLASLAHIGQYRANGDPYILHPIRVMMQMDTVEEKIVAILHDVLEDTDVTYNELDLIFGDTVMIGIEGLTKPKGVSYDDYLKQVALNTLSTKVKLADLRDNLNLLELPIIEPYHLKRAEKYYNAYRYLVGKQG